MYYKVIYLILILLLFLLFRSLDKLKKQIQEAKEAKRLAREALKKGKTGAVAAPATEMAEKSTTAAEDDDLFTVKAVHSWTPSAADDVAVMGDEYAGLSKGQIKKLKAMKLTRDGELKIAMQSAKKTTFDEDGNAVDKTIRLVKQSTAGSAADSKEGYTSVDATRIAEHAARVRERIDRSRAEDDAREKQRVREKRLNFKIAVGNNRQGGKEEDGEGSEEEGGYAVLGNADEQGSDSEDSSSQGGYNSDSSSIAVENNGSKSNKKAATH